MLGFVGFTLAAIVISVFAITFYKSFIGLPLLRRHNFTVAFLLLGLAFLIWGLIPLFDQAQFIAPLIFVGDVLLVWGSALLVMSQFNVPPVWLTTSLALAGALLLGLRAYVYTTDAYVADGLLHFGLEGTARYAVIATLAFIWMPLGARTFQAAASAHRVPQVNGIIALVYVVALVSAAVFLGSRQNEAVIASFTVLSVAFLTLAILPPVIIKMAHKQHAHKEEE